MFYIKLNFSLIFIILIYLSVFLDFNIIVGNLDTYTINLIIIYIDYIKSLFAKYIIYKVYCTVLILGATFMDINS
jgi:hypothetical protein